MSYASGIREIVFRQRGTLAIAFFVVALVALVRTGKTLGLGDSAEDWCDAVGCLIAILGHAVRVAALRHIGPNSRTSKLGAEQLTVTGPYAVVRNPLYLGNWLIAVGLCLLIQLRWLVMVGPLLIFLLYYAAALAEEPRLLEQFGEEYRHYCRATPRLLPRRLLARRGWRHVFGSRGIYTVLRTKEYQAFLVTFACAALVELHEQLWRGL